MIRITRNVIWCWDWDKPGPERRDAYGNFWELNLGPLQIYWEEKQAGWEPK